ncbi:MAG: hypothetical protein FE041_04285 [Thermoplasmata archaeon]|nr:MAG: hypothetical protein FE041_04285 [Thermoplasmata archaeon]
MVLVIPLPRSNLASPSYITLNSPNGGETLIAGEYYTIKWEISEDFPFSTAYINLYYSIDGGKNYTFIDCISAVFIGEPGYSWKVPNVISKNCKIKVTLVSKCGGIFIQFYGSDESDENFSIAYDQLYFAKDGDIKLWLQDTEATLVHIPGKYALYPYATSAGEKLAFVQVDREYDEMLWNTSEIWIADYELGSMTKITVNDIPDIEPAMSPDGKKVVFVRKEGEYSHLYLAEWVYIPLTHDYALQITQLTSGNHQDREPCFSPDGRHVVFSSNRNGKFQLYTLDIENPDIVLNALPAVPPYTTKNQRNPDWSPDGKWFAFCMEYGGQSDIYVADAWGSINTRRVFQITSTSEYEISPSWRPDGRALAYVVMEDIPDGYSFELWKMKLSMGDTPSTISNEMLVDLGYIPWEETFTLGDPCWRKLEGLRIIQTELKGRVGNYVDMSMQAIGGVPPYTWGIDGVLPGGLHFLNGRIYGTPTEAVKEHHVILNVTDSIGLHTIKDFVITIRPEHDLELLTTGDFLPPAVANTSYSAYVNFGGGLAPYEVNIASAIYGKELPPGLQWSSIISGDGLTVHLYSHDGMPPGNYKIKVEVIDAFGNVSAGFYWLNVINIDYWNVRDIFGKEFTVGVEGLPEYPLDTLKGWLTVKIKARGIEKTLTINDIYTVHRANGLLHTLVLPYPENFDTWKSVFNPGESTIIGNITVTFSIDGNEATAVQEFPIHRYMFRRDRGFSFGNFHTDGISWEDFVDFFGNWECCFFGDVHLPRPIPATIWGFGSGKMSKGMCFGMCMTANNIAEDYARTCFEEYPNLPHAEERNWDLCQPDEALDEYIEKQHWWQISMEFIRVCALEVTWNYGEWAKAVVDAVEDYVDDLESSKNPDPLLICMSYHHHGHAVVPYAIEYLPDGRALIRVYDPNKPFNYKEESDSNSSIYVDLSKDNSWTFFMGYEKEGNKTKKIVWKNGKIYAVPWKILHGDPNLPGALDIPELSILGTASLFGLIFGGTANISQVTDEEGKTMFTPEGEINTGETGIRDCFLMPSMGNEQEFLLGCASTNNSYHFSVVGADSGNYTFYSMPSMSMMNGIIADTFKNSSDRISIYPKNFSIEFLAHDSKKFGYKMIKENNESGKIFSINIKTGGKGGIMFQTDSDGNAVTIFNNDTKTNYDVKIEVVGKEKQKFQSKVVSIGKGERHRIAPESWEDISKGKIRLDIDKDNDGMWDEHIFLQKEKKKIPGFEILLLIGAVIILVTRKRIKS